MASLFCILLLIILALEFSYSEFLVEIKVNLVDKAKWLLQTDTALNDRIYNLLILLNNTYYNTPETLRHHIFVRCNHNITLLVEYGDTADSKAINDYNYSKDTKNRAIYLSSYPVEEINLLKYTGPDWTFWDWKSVGISSFQEQVNLITAMNTQKPKIDKIAWFGNIHSALSDKPEHKTRSSLIKYAEDYSDLFDFRDTCFTPDSKCGHITLHQMMADYEFILDIGGNGYSGRLKYLLHSSRPLFLVKRKYVEFFHHELIPMVHYIPVAQDLSDLVIKARWAKKYRNESNQIGLNAAAYAKENLTMRRAEARIIEVLLPQWCHHS
eukprot:gene18254-25682_t